MAKTLGMDLPGARRRQAKPHLNEYTVLALAACVMLGAAIGIVAVSAMKVGPGDGVMAPIKLHPAAEGNRARGLDLGGDHPRYPQ